MVATIIRAPRVTKFQRHETYEFGTSMFKKHTWKLCAFWQVLSSSGSLGCGWGLIFDLSLLNETPCRERVLEKRRRVLS